MTNLATVLTNTAQARPDAPALKFMGHDIGYGPLAGMAARLQEPCGRTASSPVTASRSSSQRAGLPGGLLGILLAGAPSCR